MQSYGDLSSAATSELGAGASATGQAQDYYSKILQGGTAAQQAIAPQLNTASTQQAQQKSQLASEGTSRGGGVNAATQQAGDTATKTSVDALTNLMPQAAAGEASLGTAETSAGLNAASSLGSLSTSNRAQDKSGWSTLENLGSSLAEDVGADYLKKKV